MSLNKNAQKSSITITLVLRPFQNQQPQPYMRPRICEPGYIVKQLDGFTWIVAELLERLRFFEDENGRLKAEVEQHRAEAARLAGSLTYAQVAFLENAHQTLAGRGMA